MPHSCETVRVVSPVSADNPHGFIVINKSDFDPNQHEAWPKAKKAPAAVAPVAKVVPLNPAYVTPLNNPEAE